MWIYNEHSQDATENTAENVADVQQIKKSKVQFRRNLFDFTGT